MQCIEADVWVTMSQADINQTADEFEAQLLAQRRENEVAPCLSHMLQFLLLCVSGRAFVTACGTAWMLVVRVSVTASVSVLRCPGQLGRPV